MTDANEVMDLFMKRLSNGEFEKENLSNDWPEINDDFIEKKLRSYSMLLIRSNLLLDRSVRNQAVN